MLKMENMKQGMRLLKESFNLPPEFVDAVLKKSSPAKLKKVVEERRRKYFDQLSKQQLEKLKRVYYRDFYFFDYSSSGYGTGT